MLLIELSVVFLIWIFQVASERAERENKKAGCFQPAGLLAS